MVAESQTVSHYSPEYSKKPILHWAFKAVERGITVKGLAKGQVCV